MRRSEIAVVFSWLVAPWLLAAPAPAGAQEASASGSLGGGLFGADAAATADVGVDVAGERYALGLGGRLRWVASEGVRTRDWDEPSEWATLVRYLVYARAFPAAPGAGPGQDTRISAALGPLGSARLGHGALIHGYTTGLDVDHRRLGAQVRVDGPGFGAEGLIDDVVAPRVAGARGYWQRHGAHQALSLGLSAAADFAAPRTVPATGPGMDAPGRDSEILPMVALDGSFGLHHGSERPGDWRLAGAVHAELAAISTVAAGLHLGLALEAELGLTRLSAEGALAVGTDGYAQGWVGPLYERDRVQLGEDPGAATQLDRARAGGFGRVGSTFGLTGQRPGLGELELSYVQRPGVPDVMLARLAAPYFHAVQGALWAAVETRGGARAMAMELRVRLPRRLFATVEAARLYRAAEDMTAPPGALAPWWLATLSVGATLDLAPAR